MANERYAVIDVGTNSVKFHIAERGPAGAWQRVVDRSVVTRLGEGLEPGGEITPAALDRTVEAVGAMAREAQDHHVRAIAAVGTAGLRMARNRDVVVNALRAATGVTVDVISGEDEARLAYLAVTTWLRLDAESVVVFDTGGGSSQFTFGRGSEVDEGFSIDVGAVRFLERFGLQNAVGPEVIGQVLKTISGDLGRLDGCPKPRVLVGMGGAVTTLAAVMHALLKYDPDTVQGSELSRSEVTRQIELYASRDAEGRRSIAGLPAKRADIILAGACIVRCIMDKLGRETMTVSDRGLRHGVLVDRFGS